jgi:hypothetical protein
MENLDIYILTSVISVLFIVFIIATYREFTTMGKTDFVPGKESGPRANLMFFIGSLFNDVRIDNRQRIQLLKVVKETIEVLENEPPVAPEDDANKKVV